MWPVSDQTMKEDEGTAGREAGDAAEEVPADTPADADEQTPEEAGYGYGV